jgi:hypothetical protein
MPVLNWADVVEVTHDEAKQSLLELLDSVGFTGTSWQEGELSLADVELSAEVWAQLSLIAVFIKKLGLNATATGESLTRFSDSHYDNQRDGATTAQRRITLACASGAGPHIIDIGDVVLAHADGDTYRNIDDGVTVYPATIPSGGSLAGLVFEAEVAGISANKAPNSVTQLVTTLAGVTVASDAIEVDGSAQETDAVLRTRNTTKWALLTEYELIADACVNIALEATENVTGVHVDDQNPRGAGTFDVYLADQLTTASGADVIAAQAAFDARVFGSTATPKTCLVFAASTTSLNPVATIYYKGSYEDADLEAAALVALEEFVKPIPLGGFDFYPGPSNVVPINDIEAALKAFTMAGQAVEKTIVMTGGDVSVPLHNKVILGTPVLTFTPAV